MSDDVALIHGYATDARRTWHETGWVDLLRDAGRTPHALDLLGHGEAPKPHDPVEYAQLDRWLAARLPDGPIDAIGFSLGAQLLLTIAIDGPDRFERLVLLGVGDNVFDNDSGSTQMLEAIRGTGDAEDRVTDHFHALANAEGSDPEALAACLQRERRPLRPDELAKVEADSLIVLGEDDFIDSCDRLAEALPNATVIRPRGLDHFATPKSFDCLSEALDFLDARM